MKAKTALFLTLALAALVVGYTWTQNQKPLPSADTAVQTAIEPATGDASDVEVAMESVENGDDMSTPAEDSTAMESQEAVMPTDTTAGTVAGESVTAGTDEAATPATIDTEAALAERSLGEPDAPVKIYEYASLSCGHCAHFHKTTFPAFKEKYIDTGKVYFVYNDFPLNAPALQAAMVARCLPQGRYFQFVKFLFETQEQWAYSADYSDKLRQNAKLVGLSDDAFKACIDNEDLKAGLIDRMQKASQEQKIDSTPSFVVNGKVISGAQPLESWSKIIDPLLEEKK